jgi:hypothetical protein
MEMMHGTLNWKKCLKCGRWFDIGTNMDKCLECRIKEMEDRKNGRN